MTRWPSRRWLIASMIAVAAIGLVLRLQNAWTELEILGATTVPDDSFYDFAIARNLVHGLPPSIDGVHATNGYHPLWVALLTVIFRVVVGNRAPIHVALTLGALLDVAVMFFLARIAWRSHLRLGALVAVALWAFNPYCIVNATCGLETPLALLMVLVVVDFALVSPRTPTVTWSIRFGGVLGVAILARTDAAVIGAVITAISIWRIADRSRLRTFALVFGAALVVVSPWFFFSLYTTGTLVQSSALALALVSERMPEVWGNHAITWSLRFARIAASFGEAAQITGRFFALGSLGAWSVIGAVVALAIVARDGARRRLGVQARAYAPFAVGLLALFALHAGVRQVFQLWYTAPFVAGMTLLVAIAADHLFARLRPWASLCLTTLLVLALLGRRQDWRDRKLYPSGNYRDMHPTPGLHEGHTDCGAVAYFQETGITNLDGVVNQSAMSALRERRLLDYLRAERFDRVYATDHFHSSVFFGARYRESLRSSEFDVRAVKLVDVPAEKDALVSLSIDALSLGGARGRELLDDGWVWVSEPPDNGWASSLGDESELLIALPAVLDDRPSIELELRAVVTNDRNVQPVAVFLDEHPVATFEVTREPSWYSIPASSAHPGRNRLRLVYGAPRSVRQEDAEHEWEWWRALRGNMVRAVEANGIRLVTSMRRLPPDGPPLLASGAEHFLIEGWLPVDRGASPLGVWATGPRAVIVFSSEDNALPRTLTIAAGPPPLVGMITDQQLTLSLAGTSLGTITLRPGAIEPHSLIVPAHLLMRSNRLELSFAHTAPDPVSQVDLAAYVQSVELR